jgi:DNA-binding Lrp family transcriptional regulator
MPRAYVLINVESGSEDDVLQELKTIEGVEEAFFSYGVYDLITKIKADTMDKLKEMVTRRVRTLSKVRSTLWTPNFSTFLLRKIKIIKEKLWRNLGSAR